MLAAWPSVMTASWSSPEPEKITWIHISLKNCLFLLTGFLLFVEFVFRRSSVFGINDGIVIWDKVVVFDVIQNALIRIDNILQKISWNQSLTPILSEIISFFGILSHTFCSLGDSEFFNLVYFSLQKVQKFIKTKFDLSISFNCNFCFFK